MKYLVAYTHIDTLTGQKKLNHFELDSEISLNQYDNIVLEAARRNSSELFTGLNPGVYAIAIESIQLIS